MASINIMKLHGGEAAAVLNHNRRHDGRPGVVYGNEHIDPARTHLNSTLYWRPGAHSKESAAEELARLRRRVEEIDKTEPPTRIRKDRVTLVSVEIPVPEYLLPEEETKFFKKAYSEVARFCGGAQNCGSIQIHRDEVHSYIDPVTKETKTSRVHAHMLCIPYVQGKGVNCKNFMSRDRLRQIQQSVDSRVRQDLGISFLDGSRQKSRGSVESLKLASAREEVYKAYEELSEAEQQLKATQIRVSDLKAEESRLEASTAALRAEAAELRDALPIVRRVGLAAEILDSLDSDLAEDFRQILADGGIHPDDHRDQLRLRQAAEAVEKASHRQARKSGRGRETGLDR